MGLKRFRPALEDCQQAATLQQASPQSKTLLRLARCQLMLGLLVAATSTAKEILSIDAYNPQALELQEKIRTLETQVKNSKNAKSRKEWDLAKSTLDECFRAIKGEVPTEWRLWEVEIALARRDWEKADTAVKCVFPFNFDLFLFIYCCHLSPRLIHHVNEKTFFQRSVADQLELTGRSRIARVGAFP